MQCAHTQSVSLPLRLSVQNGQLHLAPRLDSAALAHALTLVEDKKILSIENAAALFSRFVDPRVSARRRGPIRMPPSPTHTHTDGTWGEGECGIEHACTATCSKARTAH